jgi:hypothetical protein
LLQLSDPEPHAESVTDADSHAISDAYANPISLGHAGCNEVAGGNADPQPGCIAVAHPNEHPVADADAHRGHQREQHGFKLRLPEHDDLGHVVRQWVVFCIPFAVADPDWLVLQLSFNVGLFLSVVIAVPLSDVEPVEFTVAVTEPDNERVADPHFQRNC